MRTGIHLVGREPARIEHLGSSRIPSAERVDVLVVDDDDAIRSTFAEILRSSGYSVAVAEDGDVALELLDETAVGVVLLDLRMPRRDGLSVLKELAGSQLVVLASGHSLDEATLADTGANVVTFLEKPIPPERLLAVMAQTLRRSAVEGI
jgi:two-component system, NtrC family, nitrogen regulation response regulator NtrX